MYKLFIILILVLLYSCKTTEIVEKVPAPDLTAKEIREVESQLIDFKRDMLYEKYEEAAKHITKVLEIDSTHPVAYYERSKMRLQQEQYDKALFDIRFALKRKPQKLIYRKFQVLLAQQKGDVELTQQLYKKLLADFPEDQESWFNAADFYLKAKKYQEALDLLQKFEERYGFNDQILVNKYKLLIQLEKYKQLEKTLQDYAKKYPQNLQVLELLGEFYFSTDKISKGVATYKELLQKEPENSVALLSMADYYRSKKQFSKSFDYIEKVIKSKSLPVEKKIEVLINFTRIAQKDAKLEYYYTTLVKSLKEQYPNNGDVRLLYGNILLQDNEYKKAQEEFEIALENSPDNMKAWLQLIMVDNELDSNKKIIEHATSALEYFPNKAELYYYRGLAYMLREKYDSATMDLKFGNRITGKNNPLKFQFLYFLGETYYNQDSVKKAFQKFDQALNIKPNEISLLNNYAYYLSEHDMRLKEAKEMSLKTVKQAPNNSTYLDTYAWILFKMKRYEDALKYIEKAVLNGGSKSAVIMEHYGDILYKLGKKEEAYTTWKEGSLLPDATDTLLEKVEKKQYVE